MNSKIPIWVETIQTSGTGYGQSSLEENGLSKSGYHALFAGRVILRSFEELTERKWGFSQEALLREARDRQQLFVKSHHFAEDMGLVAPPDRRTLALRVIRDPHNPNLQIILLGKIFAHTREEAHTKALDYWHEISSLFPYDYTLAPISNQTDFSAISRHCTPPKEESLTGSCIEITRFEGVLQSAKTFLNVVGLWNSTLTSNEKIWRILASSSSQVTLNITLRPTILLDDELYALAQITETATDVARDSANPLTRQDAQLIHHLYLERTKNMGYAYLGQVHVYSPCKIPDYIPRAIGSALTHHKEHHSKELGYQMRRPQNKTELQDWLSAIYWLELYATSGITQDVRMQRLRYLVNIDEASTLFQFPFPSKGGIPGVNFEKNS